MAEAIELKYNKLRKKWEPKEWRPQYEEIVIKSARGDSNKQLAHEYGCTPQHISNIITTPQAKEIRSRLVENIRNTGITQQERRMMVLDKALERVEQYFFDDEEQSKRKGAMADRAMKFMSGMGSLKAENENNNITVIGDELGERLIRAITKADQVKEKYEVRPERLGSGEVGGTGS